MKIFSISDLHLDINNTKPMNVFGHVWDNYIEKIVADWNEKVADDDIVILAGDFSWAMKLEDVVPDFNWLSTLKGTKIIIRGNHDYWWHSVSKVRAVLPEKVFALQNDAIKIGDYIFCGNRGWLIPEGKNYTDENNKIYARELIRLDLSLKSAQAIKTGDEKIVYITHYPPFNNKVEPNEFTSMIEKAGADCCIFAHLHGYINPKMMYNEINGVKYYLTSCDALNNKLIQIY